MKRLSVLAAVALGCAPLAAMAQGTPPPATAPAEIDPIRLAAAKVTVGHVFPEGTYMRIMNGSLNGLMKGMMDSAGSIPIKDLAAIGGLDEQQLAGMGDGTLNQVMQIMDPAYRQRMDLGMTAMMGEMGKLVATFEPGVREGLVVAYAKRFNANQLVELNRFFETSTGSAFAADSMMLFMDPEVMARMQKAVPEMMKQMPAMIQSMEAATAHLPKPRRIEQLSREERAKLARLLGVPESQLGRRR